MNASSNHTTTTTSSATAPTTVVPARASVPPTRYAIGVDDDRHLQRHSTLEVLATLLDKLHHVDGANVEQTLSERGQTSERGEAGCSSPVCHVLLVASQAGAHVRRGQRLRRRPLSFGDRRELAVVGLIESKSDRPHCAHAVSIATAAEPPPDRAHTSRRS